MLVGYARVSTLDQNLDLQTDAPRLPGANARSPIAHRVPVRIDQGFARRSHSPERGMYWRCGNATDSHGPSPTSSKLFKNWNGGGSASAHWLKA